MVNSVQFNVKRIANSVNCAKDNLCQKDDRCKKLGAALDLSIIQCFWGNDITRIKTAVECLEYNLKIFGSGRIKDWIFVEAQKTKSEACFSWVSKYGIKYRLVKIPKESEFLFIKMPLWNIGVEIAKSNSLCFIDSDVYFEDENAPGLIESAFSKYDVIQLHSRCAGGSGIPPVNSIAFEAMRSDGVGFRTGHGGNTLGIRRSAYDEIGGFEAVNYFDDQWFWLNIFGTSPGYEKFFKLPYAPLGEISGYPFNVGAADLTIRHLEHCDTRKKYDLIRSFSYGHCRPFEDIEYDDKARLPKWSDTPVGRIMKRCFKEIAADKADSDTYIRSCISEYGKIDAEHPLVIVTSYRRSYAFKTQECVIAYREKLKQKVRNDFHYVCVTNDKIEGVDTIPFAGDPRRLLDFVFGKKIRYPKNSTVIYMRLGETPNCSEFYRMIGKRNVILDGRLISDGIER